MSCQNTWQGFEKINILYCKWLKSGDHSWMQKENCVLFIETYLLNSYQRTKTGCILCNWNKIVTSILQGLVLGALHFSIFIFFFPNKSEFYNYADHNTFHSANKNINQVTNDLSNDFRSSTKWFCDAYMVSWQMIFDDPRFPRSKIWFPS